jgi:hypothetical protein
MSRIGKAMLVVVAASYAASGIALLIGARSLGRLSIVPALVLTGWASVGHLVTLDDDATGEWSNPGGSRKVWLSSLRELLIKVALFAAALALLFAQDP